MGITAWSPLAGRRGELTSNPQRSGGGREGGPARLRRPGSGATAGSGRVWNDPTTGPETVRVPPTMTRIRAGFRGDTPLRIAADNEPVLYHGWPQVHVQVHVQSRV